MTPARRCAIGIIHEGMSQNIFRNCQITSLFNNTSYVSTLSNNKIFIIIVTKEGGHTSTLGIALGVRGMSPY